MKILKRAKQRILITIGIVIVLIIAFYIITNAITKYTGYSVSEDEREKDFENCLKQKNIMLYVNTNDVVQSLEDLKISDYLEFISIKNCMIDNSICLNSGITNFPTFVINGNKLVRDISVLELSEYSQCRLVK